MVMLQVWVEASSSNVDYLLEYVVVLRNNLSCISYSVLVLY